MSQFFSGVIHEYARTHFMSTGPTKKCPSLFSHRKPMLTAKELEFIPSPKHTIGVFSAAHHTTLRAIYSKMFPTLTEQLTEGITLPQTYHKMNWVYAHTVKNLVLNNTPQFAAQFMGCYYNTGQVKGVKKKVLKVIIGNPLHL